MWLDGVPAQPKATRGVMAAETKDPTARRASIFFLIIILAPFSGEIEIYLAEKGWVDPKTIPAVYNFRAPDS